MVVELWPTPIDLERLGMALDRLAAVSSPYLVPVVDHGVERGAAGGALPWIATRRLPAVDFLDRVLARGAALDRDWLHSVLLNIARGLSDMHAARLLHRRVTAGNVLVDGGGRAWLTGFEAARTLDVASGAGPYDEAPEGSLCTAPEQLAGPAGPPADLWAFGLLAHELLTGHHPLEDYVHGGPAAVAWAVQSQPLVREDVPAPYDELVRALLRKIPNGRPQTAKHVVRWLEEPEGVVLDPPFVSWQPRMRWVVRDAQELAATELGSADELAVGVVDAHVRARGDLARVRSATTGLGADLAIEPSFVEEENSQGVLDLVTDEGDPWDARVRQWFARTQGGLHDVELLPFVHADEVGVGGAVEVLRSGVRRRRADGRPVIGTIHCTRKLLLDRGQAFALLAACAAIEVDGWRLWVDGVQPGCGRRALRATRDAAEALAAAGLPVWVRASGIARWIFLSTPGVGLEYRAGRGLWTMGGMPRRADERVEIEKLAGPVDRETAERIVETYPDVMRCPCSVCRGRSIVPQQGPETILHNVAVVTRLMPMARNPEFARESVHDARQLRETVGRAIGCDSAAWRGELRDLENAETLLLERDATRARGALILAA